MSQSLNVIALISGGKDSIYSILHCLQNGHKVVALGNVYPLPLDSNKSHGRRITHEVEPDENDLNSHMYQTAGHTVIPLYEDALGIPLYRQAIVGTASVTQATYEKSASGDDETESLVPLLEKIMAAHPEANAVSTGAILSTYQRTRVESVTLRLGLVPLSFLWQYPCVFPMSRISLLADMASIGFDARIIKTASWALNESFLWQNVASWDTMQEIETAMMRFGNEVGAALGEGGEFETLALDGPQSLFKGRIVVEEEDRKVIHGSADTAWVRINRARVEPKIFDKNIQDLSLRVPDLFSDLFQKVRQNLELLAERGMLSEEKPGKESHSQLSSARDPLKSVVEGQKWTLVGNVRPNITIEGEVAQITAQINDSLKRANLCVAHVISTLILLRSMSYFGDMNKIYAMFFSKPNPPARVTIACGDTLPPDCNIVIQLNISSELGERRSIDDLHVQSRSYWAPANIGPYSQARSDVIYQSTGMIGLVHVAGQIPLIPATMALSEVAISPNVEVDMRTNLENAHSDMESRQFSNFIQQAVLSLQHLWRIGNAMDICWWTGTVAYLSRDTSSNIFRKAKLAAAAWSEAHGNQERVDSKGSQEYDDEERDPWEERYNRALTHGEVAKTPEKKLPDWSIVTHAHSYPRKGGPLPQVSLPPFFAAEVTELPRSSNIEWAAFLGITHGPITQSTSQKYHYTNGSALARALKHTIANRFSQTFISIPYAAETADLAPIIEQFFSELETPAEADLRRTSPGYYHAHTAYLDAGVAGLWNAEESYAGVVPCYSLWGTVGGSGLERLAAVLVFQALLQPTGGSESDESDQ